ncbi:MAG TPA: glycosyltransferase family 39 protein [Chthoniobacterales bacterium]|nr:glycosyltransferase family 39 protein [Chthoniobacterales bacterium]
MSAGAHTIRPLETLIGPKALPPPPTRHALLAFLITLAAILHLGTAGWSDIHNGAEGYYAGSAREMLHSGNTDGATLLHWLILESYRLFGVTPAAARFPIALAMIASVALTFLIGERLRDHWRGFAAGLIHLCLLGSFIWGRVVTPEPLFAAFIGGAIYCAVCGYQRQQTRRRWFAGTAVCVALAWMCEGLAGLLYPACILSLLAALFREARLRFMQLLRWPNLLIFLALVVPWQLWTHNHWLVAFGISATGREGVSLVRFVGLHAAWWFSALLLVLPGLCFAWRKVFRPHEFDFADALPLCWMAVGFLPILFLPHRQDYDTMAMWGAFSLWTAMAWERMPRRLRLFGVALVILLGIALASSAAFDVARIAGIFSGKGWRSMLVVGGAGLVVSAALGAYCVARGRETLAIAVLMLGMVPVGLSAAEAMARLGSHFSLANAAQFLESRLGHAGEVLYEGSAFAASSLRFHLHKPVLLADEPMILERFAQPHPVYLITHRRRVTHWQQRLTERFHLFHQEATCGPHVVLSNQP